MVDFGDLAGDRQGHRFAVDGSDLACQSNVARQAVCPELPGPFQGELFGLQGKAVDRKTAVIAAQDICDQGDPIPEEFAIVRRKQGCDVAGKVGLKSKCRFGSR